MNESGRPVRAVLDYFRIPSESLLVAHDELDLPPGTVRLKRDGGTEGTTACAISSLTSGTGGSRGFASGSVTRVTATR